MNLNAIWSFIIGIIHYISFVLSYAYMCIDYTWYYLVYEEIPGMEPFILTEYYGMLGFQPAGTPKLLDQF